MIDKIEVEADCWVWRGYRNQGGYGIVWDHDRLTSAHRAMYEKLVGPIPDGLQLDHLCRVRACVNPDHLEPVTPAENLRRGAGGRLRATCKRGHQLVPPNVYVNARGGRQCRQCALVRASRRREEMFG
jgi:hypothetical protein